MYNIFYKKKITKNITTLSIQCMDNLLVKVVEMMGTIHFSLVWIAIGGTLLNLAILPPHTLGVIVTPQV